MHTVRQAMTRAHGAPRWFAGVRWPQDAVWRRYLAAYWPGIAAVVGEILVPTAILSVRGSLAEAMRMTLCMLLTGLLSIILVGGVSWTMSRSRPHGARLNLAMPVVLAALVVSLNAVLPARLMYLSNQEAGLLLAFQIFGLAVAFALTTPMAKRTAYAIERVGWRAERMATGEYGADVAAGDPREARELAHLARTLDQLAAGMQDVVERRRQAEAQRYQFVRAISHDLRTPVCCMQSMIEAMADGVVSDPATVRQYHERLRNEVRRLSMLMGELFEVARLEADVPALECARVVVEDMLADAVEATTGSAERAGVAIRYQVAGALPQVEAHAEKMQWVLSELLDNAVRHTQVGGAILLHASRHIGADRRQDILVQVIDSGTGIASCDLEHVFEPTYRGDPARGRRGVAVDTTREGARPSCEGGLGLTMAQQLITAQGGHIWVASPLPAEIRTLIASPPVPCDAIHSTPGTVVSFTVPIAS